jgi:hypothetical protein
MTIRRRTADEKGCNTDSGGGFHQQIAHRALPIAEVD